MEINKAPSEQYAYSVDFAAKLVGGETIDEMQVSVTAKDFPGGLTDATAEVIAADPAPSVSGSQVIFTVMGGEAGKRYLIQVKLTTSAGNKYEGAVHLNIQEGV